VDLVFENKNLARIVYIITVDFVSTAGCNSRCGRFHIKKIWVFNIKVVLLKIKVTYS